MSTTQPTCYFCGCASFKPFGVAECMECGIINHAWDSEYTGRAPLTFADAMQVPEVRALVEETAHLCASNPEVAALHGLLEVLAPFLAAMEAKP